MFVTTLQPDSDRWDAFVGAHPRSHFLQLSGWGNFKAEFGWDDQRLALTDDTGAIVAGAQILYRRLPYRLGKLAYVPFGPLVDWADRPQVEAMMAALDQAARQQGATFMKIEPGYDVDKDVLQAVGCRSSPQTVQPPQTIVLDIGGEDADGQPIDEAAILKRMNQGTRRNIRKSDRYGISVRLGDRQDIDRFNQLLQATAERQGFGVHVPAYYERLYERFAMQPSPLKVGVLMASYSDDNSGIAKDLSGVLVFVLGTQSWYLYGASSDAERQRMAPFGVQWAAIQWAREQGAETYDMYGVPDFPPEELEARFAQENSGLWGVYRFKRGWGGRIVRTVGAWDRVYRPLIYQLYRVYLAVTRRDAE